MERTKNQTEKKKYSKYRTYKSGEYGDYDNLLSVWMGNSSVLNDNLPSDDIDTLRQYMEEAEENGKAADQWVDEIQKGINQITWRNIRKEGMSRDEAEERAMNDKGTELRQAQAQKDLYAMEAGYLSERIKKQQKAQAQEEKNQSLLTKGPVFDFKSRPVRDQYGNTTDFEPVEVDGQTVREENGIRFIDEPTSPYHLAKLESYREFCRQWKSAGSKRGRTPVPWSKLPEPPEWLEKVKETEREEK